MRLQGAIATLSNRVFLLRVQNDEKFRFRFLFQIIFLFVGVNGCYMCRVIKCFYSLLMCFVIDISLCRGAQDALQGNVPMHHFAYLKH